MLSRPTIVTENKTVHDYIESGRTGFIIKKTSQDLENVLLWLEDKDNYSHMCTAARREYEKKYSETALGKHIGKLLKLEKDVAYT